MDKWRFISKEADNTANVVSNFINHYGADIVGCAYAMSKDHRYLVGQTFNMIMYYLIQLNEDFLNNQYDERNEVACRTANKIITLLKKDGLLCDLYYNGKVKELKECRLNRMSYAD